MSDAASGSGRRASRRANKSSRAFRTISEVSTHLDVPQHVLRFWESKFSQIKPMKRGGGRRYYRPEDVALLTRIRDLLYNEGYTIRGVQKLLREKGIKFLLADAVIESEEDNINDQPSILDAIVERGGHPGADSSELNQVDKMELLSIREELLSIRNALIGLT
ncbi:MerR family transcriptional regulator [Curvivirga aplysinae]|uniref:MerR family transcriptional regulator n=1 Tax=Curvivirga aplysinae TaxID=2529852 RepID=UPI0012BD22CE|nr:MerR family transcriptional regulator [Curvivirga aplysinae]MTI09634.1 MerR family transcriptional regulator [Curvivirga aplysinae]